MFGAGHIIDVLRGSEAKKVLKFGHQRLSTYGIGREYSKKQWFHLSRQLIQKGLAIQDMEFGGLQLTDKSWDVLKKNEKVFGLIKEDWAEPAPKSQDLPEYDKEIFEILRKKRKILADKTGVPPYVIFPDKTLLEMAAYLPQTEEDLLKIYGVGEVKCKKYGPEFLNIIQDHLPENHGS